MKMRVILFLSFILIFVNSCSLSSGEKFIQGRWDHPGDLTYGTWPVTWTFKKGKFVNVAGDPPVTVTGNYRIIKEDDQNITLSLSDEDGNLTMGDEVVFKVDRVNDLLYDGNEAMKRVSR